VKFSILLPTRDRLDLLKLAIETVRLQDHEDWEIVVSDNASAQDACAYLASLGDRRMRCSRTQSVLSVTDNWNAALTNATGDYFIMLGDDDGLMPGCLSRASALIDQWDHPEAVYTEACQYSYPGVTPGHAEPFVQFGYNDFFRGATRPFRLERETAIGMVRASLSFRMRFGYNMQHFIFSRRLVEKLRAKGPFFQSPYPDYYAANAILLAAGSVIANPEPLVMIGISPKSFGYYYQGGREAEGTAFLKNSVSDELRSALAPVLVPGSNMYDSWLFAMETLARNFRDETPLRVDYARYRLIQFHAHLRSRSWRAWRDIARHARPGEVLRYGAWMLAYGAACVLPPSWRRRVHESIRASLSAFPRFDPKRRTVPARDLLQAVRNYPA
jgi:glycosyltransferase involved in cell wall biosynthesis